MRLSRWRSGWPGRRDRRAAGSGATPCPPRAVPCCAAWRSSLSVVLVLGSVGLLFGPAKPAERRPAPSSSRARSSPRWATPPSTSTTRRSGNLLNPAVDNTDEPYTAGSAFDANGNLYVADDTQGDISEYSPTGTLDGVFASGLSNPLSLVFDNSGNIYVGQQTRPTSPSSTRPGRRLPDIGPLETELNGDDWIDLASDECTFYYTTEGTTSRLQQVRQQRPGRPGPIFNADTAPGRPTPSSCRILANGDVLVADSTEDVLLGLRAATSSDLPVLVAARLCRRQLFAISVDPSGTSFWTGDADSGDICQVNIATGAVMQTIYTGSRHLYGLSVDGQLEVATPAAGDDDHARRRSTIQPVTGDFSAPTPVSAVLTNPDTDTADRQRAGHLHPQRDTRDVHRRPPTHRDRHLRHHAERAADSYTLDRLVRGRHVGVDTRSAPTAPRAPSP